MLKGELASEGVFLVLFSPHGIAGSGYIINTPVKDTPRLFMTCILRRPAEAQACNPEAVSRQRCSCGTPSNGYFY